MSKILDLETQIKVMTVLEDFVLKKIKFPFGDQTKKYEYWNKVHQGTAPPHIASAFEITEADKQNVYSQHAQGFFKETEQQKINRTTCIPQEDGSTRYVSYGMPTYYDDVLTDIKEFFEYIHSSENLNLKYVDLLRKNAFLVYSIHYDCLSIENLPIEIKRLFEKIQNGLQQQKANELIRISFLEHAESVLLDDEMCQKITSTNKDVIITNLTLDSIPLVKKAIIKTHLFDCLYLHFTAKNILNKSESIWGNYNPGDKKSIAYFYSKRDREHFKKLVRKNKKRASSYWRKAKELKENSHDSAKCNIRKKFTGDSETWLKEYVVDGQSLYQRIKEIVKNNKQRSYIKH